MEKIYELGVVGCGNMATAIVGGLVGRMDPSLITVYDPDISKSDCFRDRFKVNVSDSNESLADASKYVLLAVKPQSFGEIAQSLSGANVIISIMAGLNTDCIVSRIGRELPICRIMPNTPCLVAKGMCAITFRNCNEDSKEFVNDVFSGIAETVIVNEVDMDAVTSISGSGPAYVYLYAKHLIQAGVDGGLSHDISKKLALETIKGAVKMMEESDKPIDELVTAVCSKGGTTIQAVDCFNTEVDTFENIIREAVKRCKSRSEELAKLL